MPLLRPGVEVDNRTRYPTAEVRAIIQRCMVGRRAKPPRVIVLPQRNPAGDLAFTPFDSAQPIRIWLDPPSRYPQVGARTWKEQLAKSAGHEDWHFQHPTEECRGGSCERRAERHGTRQYRRRAGRMRRREP